jgi:pimeloyl-ACP methyl ester carboxylesterase
VVCLHGLTRNSRDFENVSPWIAARHGACWRWICAGAACRTAIRRNYDIATYVDDITALLAQLGIGRAVFVGTSMGGLITVELATRHPELVAGAVINDIGPQLHGRLGRIAGYVGQGKPLPDWQAAADACAAMNADVFAHYGPADWMAMARRLFREDDGRIIADYDPGIARALARIVADPDPWGKWHDFAAKRPVLVLRGTVTDLLDEDVAQAMVAGKPRAVLAPVQGGPRADDGRAGCPGGNGAVFDEVE